MCWCRAAAPAPPAPPSSIGAGTGAHSSFLPQQQNSASNGTGIHPPAMPMHQCEASSFKQSSGGRQLIGGRFVFPPSTFLGGAIPYFFLPCFLLSQREFGSSPLKYHGTKEGVPRNMQHEFVFPPSVQIRTRCVTFWKVAYLARCPLRSKPSIIASQARRELSTLHSLQSNTS